MEPAEWNIVVVAAWNHAILTPQWIAREMLGVAPNVPVDVLVPLDAANPFQVCDNGLTVIPGTAGHLIIKLAQPTAELLAQGMDAAKRAIKALPITPLRACGINLRYSANDPPTALLDRMRCATEQIFSDSGYDIRVRRRGESLVYCEGTLNILADIPTAGKCELTLNFDCQSTKSEEIIAWLERNASEYTNESQKIIALIAD